MEDYGCYTIAPNDYEYPTLCKHCVREVEDENKRLLSIITKARKNNPHLNPAGLIRTTADICYLAGLFHIPLIDYYASHRVHVDGTEKKSVKYSKSKSTKAVKTIKRARISKDTEANYPREVPLQYGNATLADLTAIAPNISQLNTITISHLEQAHATQLSEAFSNPFAPIVGVLDNITIQTLGPPPSPLLPLQAGPLSSALPPSAETVVFNSDA